MFPMTKDEIIRASVATMLWQAPEPLDFDDAPFDEMFDVDDLDPAGAEVIYRDVTNFTNAVRPDDLAAYLDAYSPDSLIHDYWLTRNGHGAGFWDRGLGDPGERMSSLARTDGMYYLYSNDGETWNWE